jgi:hypothetical protein
MRHSWDAPRRSSSAAALLGPESDVIEPGGPELGAGYSRCPFPAGPNAIQVAPSAIAEVHISVAFGTPPNHAPPRVRQFLTPLVVERNLSVATQQQALGAAISLPQRLRSVARGPVAARPEPGGPAGREGNAGMAE